MMNDEILIWLIKWYFGQCNGDWEHGNGIKIDTLDNPGWVIKIGLNETTLQNKEFQNVEIERSENDWIHCRIKNHVFVGAGGPFNLVEILQIFRSWAEKTE